MPRGVYERTPEMRARRASLEFGNQRHMTHGHARDGKHSPTWHSWANMVQRCTNPKNPRYADYGGRGIMVCAAWVFFEAFLTDMGEQPESLTLDRIDNDGNYEPANCRWITKGEQNANRRPRRWHKRPV